MPDDLDILLRHLKRASSSVAVGALDGETARKLSYSEFGTVREPARPTLTAATDRAEASIFRAVDRKVHALLDGRATTGRAIMQEVGNELAELVRDEIGNNTPPPLADFTIAARRRRGNFIERTLVDSGDMQRGIKAEVRDGEGGWPDAD